MIMQNSKELTMDIYADGGDRERAACQFAQGDAVKVMQGRPLLSDAKIFSSLLREEIERGHLQPL
jgi:hypothetical protein